MRNWIFVVGSLVAGIVSGTTTTFMEISRHGIDLLENERAKETNPVPRDYPRVVVVGEESFYFGVMQRDETKHHKFVFRNDGNAPLRMKTKSTTCKCTISRLQRDAIPPGETGEVTLEWTPDNFSPEFHQSAQIETNDPRRKIVVLSIKGRVAQAMWPVPRDVVFSRISVGRARTARVSLFGFRDKTLQVVDHQFTNPDTAEFFDAHFEPMSAETLAEQADATSGVSIDITVKPGLPLGPFQQTIRLSTNLEDFPMLKIPIQGTVKGDISVIGSSKFERDRNMLSLGPIASDMGAEETLFILVKGSHRETVSLSVGRVDPDDVIQVAIGDAESLSDGAVIKFPVTVSIPPGSRPTNRLGSKQSLLGEIVIETTHSQARQITLYVRFAIQR